MSGITKDYIRAVEPTQTGLPRRWSLFIPLGLLALTLLGLVGFGVTGSSTGYYHSYVSNAEDPRHIIGGPQPIRSDEWFVQSSWTISQMQQEFPAENQALLGGFDATVQNELPTHDWSTAFRPHLIGYLFLPLNQAAALKWWLPAFTMIAAIFVFFVTLMPRRPIASLTIAVSVLWMPMMQWWFMPITHWPVALSFLIMATSMWCVRSASASARWMLAVITGYVAVATGMSIYVPFILGGLLPAAAFTVALLFERKSRVERWNIVSKLKSMIPLFFSGLASLVVIVIWAMTRWQTIVGFTSTVYPGDRSVLTGSASALDWRTLFSAPFTMSIFGGDTLYALGPNSSEASTVILVGLFLVFPIGWLAVERYRRLRLLDPMLIAMLTVLVVIVAFWSVPGWDWLAQLIGLDLVPVARWRLLFGIVSTVLIGLLMYRIDCYKREVGHNPALLGVALVASGVALAAIVIVWLSIALGGTAIAIGSVPSTLAITVTLIFCFGTILTVFVLSQGWASLGAAGLLLLSIAGTVLVNPVYRGIHNLNETEIVKEMLQIQEASDDPDARWVAVGDGMVIEAILIQSALPGLNGFQGAPSPALWGLIDPQHKHEQVWNRIANISWGPGVGEPNPTNPAPDQIRMTFDSCDSFAQNNVNFVLADKPLNQECLVQISRVQTGTSDFRVYEVTKELPSE